MKLALVVDDKEEQRYYLQVLLQSAGYTVVAAQDGVEALVKARQSLPDIVISDLLMPVMDGFSLLTQWKADPQLRDIPFVVHTATYTEPEDERLALNLGADAFIVKPAEPSQLFAILNQLTGSRSSATPTTVAGADDPVMLKEYNQALVRKLEEKSLQLEHSNRALQLDIADRVKAEQTLRLLNSAVMQSQESILITDAQLEAPGPTIVFVNPAFTAMTGYAAEDVVGKTPRILQGPLTDRAVMARLLRNLADGAIFDGETINYRKDGTPFVLEWQVAPIRNPAGEITHYASAQRDVTARRQIDRALEESRNRLELATQSAQMGIWDWDIVADTIIWDQRMYRIFGFEESAGIGAAEAERQTQHPDPAERQRIDQEMVEALAGKKNFHLEFRILQPGGQVRTVESHAIVQRAADGSPIRMIGVSWDITERKDAALRIHYLTRVYAMHSGISTLIVRERDSESLLAQACQVAVEQGGFRMAMMCTCVPGGNEIVPVASAGKSPGLVEAIRQLLSTPESAAQTLVAQVIREKRTRVINDAERGVGMLLSEAYLAAGVRSLALLPLLVRDEAVGVLALYATEPEFFHAEEMQLLAELSNDIAFALDSIEKQARLDYIAYHDVLTGLANRRLFLDRLTQSLRVVVGSGHKLAVLVIDLERFKYVNDGLGRAAGDLLLQRVADWLLGRVTDAWQLARMGANQFALLLPDVQGEQDVARLVDDELGLFLKQSFLIAGTEVRMGARIGIAMFPEDGSDSDLLFKNAEAALAKAKAGGDRYLFYASRMSESIAGRLTMENQLRLALLRDEFVLHYQPKVTLQGNKLVGVEALLRWNSPHTGLVPPAQFVSILEDTGLIYEVGSWALGKAVEDHLRWRRQGLLPVRIAVNVSALQLRHHDFTDRIRQLLASDPWAASALELEITESVIMRDVENGVARLQAIRAMGVPIAIDDFGTGFSSLSYLAKLPVDTLKIDRAFITDMTASASGMALVTTIIKLAHALNLKVVAEGVETDEQARLLRLLFCDEMQGYLFSRPVSSEVLEQQFLALRQDDGGSRAGSARY